MRFFSSTAAVAAFLFSAQSAYAETRLAALPVRYLLVPPMDAGEKQVRKGETVFEFPLRWDEAATFSQEVQLDADGRSKLIKKGQVLVRTSLQFDSKEFAQAKAFCIPRKAAPVNDRMAGRFLGKLGMKLVRSQTDGQFCLLDRDNDGLADHSVLLNDGSVDARMPRPIAPVAYDVSRGAPVWEGDKLRIVYLGKYLFQLDFVEQGVVRQFDSYSVNTPEGPRLFLRQAHNVKDPDGSHRIVLPGILLTAAAHDKAKGSVIVRWPTMTTPTIMPVPEDVKFTYLYGY